MAGYNRTDNATKEQRVEAIYRLLIDGMTTRQILPQIAKWGIKERQQRYYIAEARERMIEVHALERELIFAEHIAARRQLRRDAKTVKEKLDVLKDEAALLGLYPAKAVELYGKGGGAIIIDMTWGDNDDGGNTNSPA